MVAQERKQRLHAEEELEAIREEKEVLRGGLRSMGGKDSGNERRHRLACLSILWC